MRKKGFQVDWPFVIAVAAVLVLGMGAAYLTNSAIMDCGLDFIPCLLVPYR